MGHFRYNVLGIQDGLGRIYMYCMGKGGYICIVWVRVDIYVLYGLVQKQYLISVT